MSKYLFKGRAKKYKIVGMNIKEQKISKNLVEFSSECQNAIIINGN